MNILKQKIKTNGEFVVKQIDEDFILVPLHNNIAKTNMVYTLNELAFFIWKHLDGTQIVDSIIDEILEEFDVSREEAEKDTLKFLADINELLIVIN